MKELEIAEKQHGLVARWQLRVAGRDRAGLARRLDSGDWVAESGRVLRRGGAPQTPHQRVMALVLDAGPGAVASHRTAAWLWGVPGFGPGPAEVSLLRGMNGCASPLGVVHRPRLLPSAHVTATCGIPVTTPERTLCDLAAVVGPLRIERAVDSALARHTADLARLWLAFDDLAARRRPGRRVMRRILAERPPGYVAPESELEARFLRMVERAGIVMPECQVDVGGAAWVGRVDFLFRCQRLVVEVDGQLAHSALSDRRNDEQRDEALKATGFDVLRFGWSDVVLDPRRTVGVLRRSLAARAAPAPLPPFGTRNAS